jgi:DHA2 family multidrug resistance protein
MAVMDISVVNVAIPHMMGTFGAGIDEITWVGTGYAIAEILMVSLTGWWSTLLGRKRFYLASFALFIGGSVLCGTARSLGAMVFYRVIQGIGAGAMIPLSQAILRETFPPEEQGMAAAVFSMGVVVAPAAGPVVGGWLTEAYSWPWVFYINVPVGIVAMVMVSLVLRDPPYLRRGIERVDVLGLALLLVGITAMQIVLERGQREAWFASRLIVGLTAATVATLAGLAWRELRTVEPVVDLRLLKNIPLAAGTIIGTIFGVALLGRTFILPQLLQSILGFSPFQTGLALLARPAGMMVFMPIAGRLYNYVDPRLLIAGGIAATVWASLQLARLSLDVGMWDLALPLFLVGFGNSFMFVTMATAALSTIPRAQMTGASGLFTLGRRIGGNIGYALVATMTERRTAFHRARLIARVTPLDLPALARRRLAIRLLHRRGSARPLAAAQATRLLEATVRRQARMLAFNDVAWILGVLFVFALPLLIFLPRRPRAID